MLSLSLGLSLTSGQGGGAAGFAFTNAEAEAYVAAMSTEPDDTRKALIDTYIGALKTAGIFANLDVLYLLAAHDQQAARLNVINPATFTLANVGAGPTFSADNGFAGNGTSTALNTQFTPSTDGVNFQQDESSFCVWALTGAQSDAVDIGSIDNAAAYITARNTSNHTIYILCDETPSTLFDETGTDFIFVKRFQSFRRYIFVNGVQQAFASIDSTGEPADEQWICGGNGGTPSFSERQIAFAAWGAGMDTLEEAFYDATLAYLQGVGAVA
jgi:hypothetical protein